MVQELTEVIKKRQENWFGHIMRNGNRRKTNQGEDMHGVTEQINKTTDLPHCRQLER